jgi:uncharacterized protein (TIGR00297 family)
LVLSLLLAAIGVAATAILAGGAVAARALTRPAGLVAAVFGSVIVVVAGFPYLALLILFVVASVLATRYHLEDKRRKNVQEGAHGERHVPNVVAHILIPTALALTALGSPSILPASTRAVLYASALAFGAADTFASEFGVLAGSARSILTLRAVEPGTNGGVSGMGEAFALIGALAIAVLGAGLFWTFGAAFGSLIVFVLVVTVAGFLACQVDSVLGETLENSGHLSKHSTNFLGMLSAVAIAGLAVFAVRGGL